MGSHAPFRGPPPERNTEAIISKGNIIYEMSVGPKMMVRSPSDFFLMIFSSMDSLATSSGMEDDQMIIMWRFGYTQIIHAIGAAPRVWKPPVTTGIIHDIYIYI